MLINLQRKELNQLNQEEEQQKEDIQQEVIVSVKNTGTAKAFFKICDEI
jgi:hypothetical protein